MNVFATFICHAVMFFSRWHCEILLKVLSLSVQLYDTKWKQTPQKKKHSLLSLSYFVWHKNSFNLAPTFFLNVINDYKESAKASFEPWFLDAVHRMWAQNGSGHCLCLWLHATHIVLLHLLQFAPSPCWIHETQAISKSILFNIRQLHVKKT